MPVSADSKMLAETLFNLTKIRISPRYIHNQNDLSISMGSPAQMEKLKSGLKLALAAS